MTVTCCVNPFFKPLSVMMLAGIASPLSHLTLMPMLAVRFLIVLSVRAFPGHVTHVPSSIVCLIWVSRSRMSSLLNVSPFRRRITGEEIIGFSLAVGMAIACMNEVSASFRAENAANP